MEHLEGAAARLADPARRLAPARQDPLGARRDRDRAGRGACALQVIHRDLKPSNVILAERHLKILDFGVARMAGDSKLTQTGFAVGSPLYMSPEQLQGLPLDGRCDLYALGVLAFALLTGREPFVGGTMTVIAMNHLQSPIPDPRKHRPGLPARMGRSWSSGCSPRRPRNARPPRPRRSRRFGRCRCRPQGWPSPGRGRDRFAEAKAAPCSVSWRPARGRHPVPAILEGPGAEPCRYPHHGIGHEFRIQCPRINPFGAYDQVSVLQPVRRPQISGRGGREGGAESRCLAAVRQRGETTGRRPRSRSI